MKNANEMSPSYKKCVTGRMENSYIQITNTPITNNKYKKIKTKDNTFTLKSLKYNECYHSSEGALKETFYKHVGVALDLMENIEEEIRILDICFGLGYNTFVTVLNRPVNKKLKIFSPELDLDLIKSLKNFEYPKEFEKIKNIIEKISENLYYKDEFLEIEVANINARDYIKKLENIHFVYQDAFSPRVNPELWTMEYFKDIKKILNKNGVISTYSVATPVRCALYKLGFKLYTHKFDIIRKGTIATMREIDYPKVDFEEKLKRIECKTYSDKTLDF